MGDEFQLGSSSGNWWDTSRTSESMAASALNTAGSFGWPAEMVDIKARSSMDSLSISGSSSMVFPDSHHHHHHKPQLQGGGGDESSAGGTMLADPNLQLIGLGLSSQAMDWNQPPLFRDEKAATSSFRSMLQEGMRSNANFQQDSSVASSAHDNQDQWRNHHHPHHPHHHHHQQQQQQQKIYSATSDDSSVNDYKQIHRGFSLDQHTQYASHINCSSDSTSSFQMDSNNPTILQGLLTSDNHPSMNYAAYPSTYAATGDLMPSNWSKFPPFLRGSPPKQAVVPPPSQHGQLHFANSTPFWNATTAAMNDVRASFFPSLQTQLPTPSFDDKPKNISEGREVGTAPLPVKKSGGEGGSSKRPRSETPSALPAFKVRKEKMGDRITALQQLVSPFGKTDTASVLSEAIEYIKFLHEQVNVLSNPYMKSGAPLTHPQSSDKSKDPEQGPRQDLRSRGLCLVPVSSTFPVTHETAVDFWTPTFGGTFR